MAIRFHLDENLSPAIAAGLRRRGIDCTTARESGLLGATDLAQLDFARRAGRVFVTHDVDFLSLAAAGHAHAGIVHCRAGPRSVGRILAQLELIHLCLSEQDMMNHIEFA